ncbi:MAG: TIGR01244 family sulfur transferase [Pseudomonadota bacterium]
MSQFRKLDESMMASPQISIDDLTEAQALGVTLIINNRPDGEDPNAPQSDAIESAANALGLQYVAIPIGHSGFSEAQVDAMCEALDQADGNILAYCRSGTRSTFLWALAEAKSGVSSDTIAAAALSAGYDVAPIRPMLDMLAARQG